MPDLRSLELLVTVARAGSLSRAASELDITQQAASARVRTMEAAVGAALLNRSTRGSSLTRTGELLAQWASTVLEAAEKLDAGVNALRTGQRAHVRIAASLTIAEHLLPQWLVELRRMQRARGEEPTEFTLIATNSDRVAELVHAEEVDLGFVEGPELPRSLHARVLGVDRLAVVVSPEHAWARRTDRRISAQTLVGTPLILRESGSGTRQALEHALERLGSVRTALELSSTTAVRAAVQAGEGPAALSVHAVREDLATGRLVEIAVTGTDLSRGLHAIWSGTRRLLHGPVRDLVDLGTGSLSDKRSHR